MTDEISLMEHDTYCWMLASPLDLRRLLDGVFQRLAQKTRFKGSFKEFYMNFRQVNYLILQILEQYNTSLAKMGFILIL